MTHHQTIEGTFCQRGIVSGTKTLEVVMNRESGEQFCQKHFRPKLKFSIQKFANTSLSHFYMPDGVLSIDNNVQVFKCRIRLDGHVAISVLNSSQDLHLPWSFKILSVNESPDLLNQKVRTDNRRKDLKVRKMHSTIRGTVDLKISSSNTVFVPKEATTFVRLQFSPAIDQYRVDILSWVVYALDVQDLLFGDGYIGISCSQLVKSVVVVNALQRILNEELFVNSFSLHYCEEQDWFSMRDEL